MSNLTYIMAASSSKNDLSDHRHPREADDTVQRGRRRVVFGEEPDPVQEYDDSDYFYPNPESPSSPDTIRRDCSLSDALTNAIAERLPNWGTWLASFHRTPYWVDSPPSRDVNEPSFGYFSNLKAIGVGKSPRHGSQPDGLDGLHSPPSSNEVEASRGVVAYLLVASGEDVRHEDMVVSLAGNILQSLQLALPLVGSNLLQFLLCIVSFAIVGHIGVAELAATGLALAFTRVTGHVILTGLSGSLDILYSQSKASSDPQLQMIYFLRATLILSLCCLPIGLMWRFCSPLLLFLGQDSQLAAMATSYVLWLLPSLAANAFIQPVVRYIQVQKLSWAMDVCAGVTLLVHIIATWILVAGFGFLGSAMATSFSYILNLLLLGTCAWRSPSRQQLDSSFQYSKVFDDINHFFRIGLLPTAIACMESWGMHALFPLAGLLPKPELQLTLITILLSWFLLSFTFSFGFSAALSFQVSKHMAAGRPRTAWQTTFVGLPMCAAVGGIFGGLMILLKGYLAYLFSGAAEVVEGVEDHIRLLATIIFIDAIQEGLLGVVRGCGQQNIGAIINLASDCIGIASAYYFGLVLKMELTGMLLGMLIGIAGQSLALLLVIMTDNWADQSVKVIRRVESRQDGLLSMNESLLV